MSKEHPLSGGQIEIKYTDEKGRGYLTSTLIQKGIVLDKLMKIIIQDGVKPMIYYWVIK